MDIRAHKHIYLIYRNHRLLTINAWWSCRDICSLFKGSIWMSTVDSRRQNRHVFITIARITTFWSHGGYGKCEKQEQEAREREIERQRVIDEFSTNLWLAECKIKLPVALPLFTCINSLVPFRTK